MYTEKGARYLRVENIKEYKKLINDLSTRGYFRTAPALIDKNGDGSYVERLEFYNKKKMERRVYTAKYKINSDGTHNVDRYMLEIF